jgi:hypothetical protein
MTEVIYEIVEHNGGFAYRVGDVFSETFATHAAAREAAQQAAQRQQLQGSPDVIQYQDSDGKWHKEVATGTDHPQAEVNDDLPSDLEARDSRGRVMEEREVPNPDLAPIGNLNHHGNGTR